MVLAPYAVSHNLTIVTCIYITEQCKYNSLALILIFYMVSKPTGFEGAEEYLLAPSREQRSDLWRRIEAMVVL
jgi:hypothetical protein